jgi:hypothetical protein
MNCIKMLYKNFIVNYWQGTEKLWKAFWIIGIISFIVMRIISTLFWGTASESSLALWAIILFLTGYIMFVWWAVAVWRCAPNTSKIMWKWLSRIVIIVSCANNFYYDYNIVKTWILCTWS